jgi:hypothetical protein
MNWLICWAIRNSQSWRMSPVDTLRVPLFKFSWRLKKWYAQYPAGLPVSGQGYTLMTPDPDIRLRQMYIKQPGKNRYQL